MAETTDAKWFYAADGQQKGPVTIAQLREETRRGIIFKNTLIWAEGMPNWKQIWATSLRDTLFGPAAIITRSKSSRSVVSTRKKGVSVRIPRCRTVSPEPSYVVSHSVRDGRKNSSDRPGRVRVGVDLKKQLEMNFLRAKHIGGGKSLRRSPRSRNDPPPPPKTNILSCITQGKGLTTAIKDSSDLDLCLYLPAICLAIESTPVWFKKHQNEAVAALRERVLGSDCVAQMMSLIFISRSIRMPSVFEKIRQDLLKPNSTIGDTMMYDYPTNQLVEKGNKKRLKQGFVLEAKGRMFHPFQLKLVLKEIRVLRVFKTNSKPVLVSMLPCAQIDDLKMEPMKVIVKQGDDFRQDVASMIVFRFFNHLWRLDRLVYKSTPVRCHAYNTTATGVNIGVIEFVENCYPLSQLKKRLGPVSSEKIERLVASGAGSYIASYILGIRDRHADNIMLREDGTMFHIDFGRVFGDAVLMDTSTFAITKAFKDAIGSKAYSEFVNCCTEAFKVLRKKENVELIKNFAPTVRL